MQSRRFLILLAATIVGYLFWEGWWFCLAYARLREWVGLHDLQRIGGIELGFSPIGVRLFSPFGMLLHAPPILIALLSYYLLRKRWYAAPGDLPRCRKCGHILRGLTAPRCPECGTEI